jgi:hypothetical protein
MRLFRLIVTALLKLAIEPFYEVNTFFTGFHVFDLTFAGNQE